MSTMRIRSSTPSASAFLRFARPVRAPHLFEIVELADVGTEDMNDRVARVEQHPIAKRQSLNARRGEACVAAGPDDTVGDRADMSARTPGCDNHSVGERRFAGKLD